MALQMYGQVVIQAAVPEEDPVRVGTVWIDTSGTPVLKVCTSVSPYTFAEISGSGGDHGALTGLTDDDHPQYLLRTELADETPASPGSDLVGVPSLSATYSTLEDVLNVRGSTGLVSGLAVTDGGSGTYDISAGVVALRPADTTLAQIQFVDFAGASAQSLTDNTLSYIYVEFDGATLTLGTTTTPTQKHNRLYAGAVYRNGSALHITNFSTQTAGTARRFNWKMIETEGLVRAFGAVVSEAGTRNIATTAGEFYLGMTEFITPAVDTSGAGTFLGYYRNGSGGFTEQTGQTQINNTQYDDGSGTLATLTAGRYGVFWVYVELDGDLAVVFGRGNYTLSEAQAAQPPSDLPGQVATFHAALAAKIIIQKSAASFTAVETAYLTRFSPTPVSDHGALAGLADDDHTQYALKPNEQTTTSTGTQNNFSLTKRDTYLRCNNASALVLTGFSLGGATPAAGDRVIVHNVGSSTVRVASQDTGSTAEYRCIFPSTRGQIIGAGGSMVLTYDATTSRWRVGAVEPGAVISVAYNGADFTAGAGTWTVDSGDVGTHKYQQRGTTLKIIFQVSTTTQATAATNVHFIALPNGFTVANGGVQVVSFGRSNDGTNWFATLAGTNPSNSTTVWQIFTITGANTFVVATNVVYHQGVVVIEVD